MSNYRNIPLDRLCAAFGALSNPHRLRIFLRLSACCPPGSATEADETCCVGELGAELDVAPSTVSHHIKELERCGLIRVTRRGRNMICQANGEAVAALRGFFNRPVVPIVEEKSHENQH